MHQNIISTGRGAMRRRGLAHRVSTSTRLCVFSLALAGMLGQPSFSYAQEGPPPPLPGQDMSWEDDYFFLSDVAQEELDELLPDRDEDEGEFDRPRWGRDDAQRDPRHGERRKPRFARGEGRFEPGRFDRGRRLDRRSERDDDRDWDRRREMGRDRDWDDDDDRDRDDDRDWDEDREREYDRDRRREGPPSHGRFGRDGVRREGPMGLMDPQRREEMRENILAVVSDIDPDRAERLERLLEHRPEMALGLLREHLPHLLRLVHLREQNPDMYEIRIHDINLARESEELADHLHELREEDQPNENQVNEVRTRLRDLVIEHFEVRQHAREHELHQLEQRIDELRQQLEARSEAREKLIQRRLRDLLGEDDHVEW